MTHAVPARRALRLGAALVVVYTLTIVVTLRAGGHHVRPLFEGIGPPAPYQWVNPPAEFAAANVKPKVTRSDLTLGAAGTPENGVASLDGQLVLNLPDGAIAAHPGDTTVTMVVTPLDPAKLGAPPAGLHADGNVYRVEASYGPSGQAVDQLAKAGNIVMTLPGPGETLLYSADGRTWVTVASQQVGGPTALGASFAKPGYYVGGARTAAAASGKTGGGGGGAVGIVLAAVATAAVVLALGIIAVPAISRRRKRPQDPPPRRGRR